MSLPLPALYLSYPKGNRADTGRLSATQATVLDVRHCKNAKLHSLRMHSDCPCPLKAFGRPVIGCSAMHEDVDKAFHVLRHILWLQASSLAFLEYHLRTVLGNDSSAISTLRCLKLYLERLGCNHLDTDTMHSVAGSAFKLVCLHSIYLNSKTEAFW